MSKFPLQQKSVTCCFCNSFRRFCSSSEVSTPAKRTRELRILQLEESNIGARSVPTATVAEHTTPMEQKRSQITINWLNVLSRSLKLNETQANNARLLNNYTNHTSNNPVSIFRNSGNANKLIITTQKTFHQT